MFEEGRREEKKRRGEGEGERLEEVKNIWKIRKRMGIPKTGVRFMSMT